MMINMNEVIWRLLPFYKIAQWMIKSNAGKRKSMIISGASAAN